MTHDKVPSTASKINNGDKEEMSHNCANKIKIEYIETFILKHVADHLVMIIVEI